jgi:hypothetical protein
MLMRWNGRLRGDLYPTAHLIYSKPGRQCTRTRVGRAPQYLATGCTCHRPASVQHLDQVSPIAMFACSLIRSIEESPRWTRCFNQSSIRCIGHACHAVSNRPKTLPISHPSFCPYHSKYLRMSVLVLLLGERTRLWG